MMGKGFSFFLILTCIGSIAKVVGNDNLLFPDSIVKFQKYSVKLNEKISLNFEITSDMLCHHQDLSVFENHRDDIYNFSNKNKLLNIIITKRKILNGDIFFFINSTNLSERGYYCKFSIIVHDIGADSTYFLDKYYKKPPYSPRYGENKLTTPFAYVNTDQGSAFISKNIIFRNNVILYSDSSKSNTKVLEKELTNTRSVTRENDLFIVSYIKIPAKKNSDFFCLISGHDLFNSDKNFNKFFQEYSDALANNDVRFTMWMTSGGTYSKLPYAIEPFHREAYGVSLQHASKMEMLKYFQLGRDRFFYDFISNAVIQIYGYAPARKGIFMIDYTSTWLKDDFNIRAPFIDTRQTELLAIAFRDYSKLLFYKELNNYSNIYADFLIEYSEIGELVKLNDTAFFFPDYFAFNDSARVSHASLNHQLGIINFLFEKYSATRNRKFLELTGYLFNFMEFCGDTWVKDNGDLYYKVSLMANGSFKFSDQDYVYVTLNDLIRVQENSIKFFFKKNETVDHLIRKKIKYLEENGYGLTGKTSKLPPEEDLHAREITYRNAKALGYCK